MAGLILLQKTNVSVEKKLRNIFVRIKGVETCRMPLTAPKDILLNIFLMRRNTAHGFVKRTLREGLLVTSAKDEKAQSVYEMYYNY